MRLVMIDNYDSFTYNLAQLFYEFDLDVEVYRHDQIGIEEIEARRPDWICISPGPKDPGHAGISKSVIAHFAPSVPILGVCLGMQAINEVFGGVTRKAPEPRHGKRSRVFHQGEGIMAGLPSPIVVARYHSLQVIMSTDELRPLAHAEDGVVMGLQHRHWPLCGVQFHPESFMTEYGWELAANFLALQPCWRAARPPASPGQDRFPRVGWPRLPTDGAAGGEDVTVRSGLPLAVEGSETTKPARSPQGGDGASHAWGLAAMTGQVPAQRTGTRSPAPEPGSELL